MRIAILGGTFDPIHNGHIAVAEAVAIAFAVDAVHLVPAFSSPYKSASDTTSPFHRFAMVVLATMPFDRFCTSSVEVDSLEKSYSVDTLGWMRRMYPASDLLFVIGTDMYLEIEGWKDFRRLFELAHLVIVNRPGSDIRQDVVPLRTIHEREIVGMLDEAGASYMSFVSQPISSSEIRDERKRGRDVRHWLPTPVWSYIEKNRLYL